MQSADHNFEQPCVGKFVNLRVEDQGNTLYGDLVGVPKWLAEILPTAYPSRSVEAYFGVSTATNRKHEMIVTSVALLGENLPGVSTLDDLEYLFSDEPTDLSALSCLVHRERPQAPSTINVLTARGSAECGSPSASWACACVGSALFGHDQP